MANTFRSFSKASIGTSPTTAYQLELDGNSSKTAIVIGIALSNRASTPINVDVQIDRPVTGDAEAPTEDVYLARNIPIPSGSTLEIMAGQKQIMQIFDTGGSTFVGDKIVATSDTASSLDVIVNSLEITS
jgi:hypothetical protein